MPSTYGRIIIGLALLTAYRDISYSQNRHSADFFQTYYTGCWKTEFEEDGHLETKRDGTFLWIKPKTRNADTLRGTWRIVSVYGIPFKSDAISLKFHDGRRRKYEVGVTSQSAIIYLAEHHHMRKVSCEY